MQLSLVHSKSHKPVPFVNTVSACLCVFPDSGSVPEVLRNLGEDFSPDVV